MYRSSDGRSTSFPFPSSSAILKSSYQSEEDGDGGENGYVKSGFLHMQGQEIPQAAGLTAFGAKSPGQSSGRMLNYVANCVG